VHQDLSTLHRLDRDLARILWQAFIHYCRRRAARGGGAGERPPLFGSSLIQCEVRLDIRDPELREFVASSLQADKLLVSAGLKLGRGAA
jgi:hypothetical protein